MASALRARTPATSRLGSLTYRESVFTDAQEAQGFRIVSDLQLYLDLKHYPVRGLEAASQILERHLARERKLVRVTDPEISDPHLM